MAPQKQVNVRLDEETIELLDAAAWIDGLNLLDEVRTAIQRHAAEVAKDPDVQDALRLRRRRRPAEEELPRIRSLEDKRRGSKTSR